MRVQSRLFKRPPLQYHEYKELISGRKRMRLVAMLAVLGLTGCSWFGFGSDDAQDQGAASGGIAGLSVDQVAAPIAADGTVLVDSLAEVVPEPAL
ncbi:MAG: hypothetical protein HUJ24_01845, partial [Rhodobacteraceae bacterium]|nr:hypothetical protein [Paracoccaceae bacterium]